MVNLFRLNNVGFNDLHFIQHDLDDPKNTNLKARLGTVYLLIKVACFIKKEIMFALSIPDDTN